MRIVANGISINYELIGSGRCLALIHGAGDNLHAWWKQVPAFSQHHRQRYRVLIYDVRGHGETELPEGELGTDVWAADLHALLKTLGIGEAILLGYSMGGGIALQCALEHPEMVKALILSNSAPGAPASQEAMREREARRQASIAAIQARGIEGLVDDRIPRVFSPGFAERDPETVERYKAVIRRNDPQAYLRVTGSMFRPGPPPDLGRVRCPTLVIVGEHDPFSGPEAARAVQQAIPGAQLVVFPTGHPSALEIPEAYNAAVLDFLKGAGL